MSTMSSKDKLKSINRAFDGANIKAKPADITIDLYERNSGILFLLMDKSILSDNPNCLAVFENMTDINNAIREIIIQDYESGRINSKAGWVQDYIYEYHKKDFGFDYIDIEKLTDRELILKAGCIKKYYLEEFLEIKQKIEQTNKGDFHELRNLYNVVAGLSCEAEEFLKEHNQQLLNKNSDRILKENVDKEKLADYAISEQNKWRILTYEEIKEVVEQLFSVANKYLQKEYDKTNV